ncbi:MAG: hypothetical protein PHC43_00100 [Candidatus Marinimicrobia bacterium]|jgi:hypothetical protein|nr:hypothetical protein [Candidatus Neomarinimicrobiota bacterium]
MAREEYNKCMIPWIKGKEGLDRRMSFCAGAKICSGKAKTLDEAKSICNERFTKKKAEDVRLTVDDLKVKLDGKEVIISADVFNKLCGCKR